MKALERSASEWMPARRPIAESIAFNMLRELSVGTLAMQYNGKRHQFGQHNTDRLHASLDVHRPDLFRKLLMGGTIGAAESYMDGDWDSEDLTSLIRVILRNQAALDRMESGFARIGRAAADAIHRLRKNTKAGSRRNIAAHYDLGNDFFEKMLDETMTYSAAYWHRWEDDLATASRAKLERLGEKLELGPEDHLLEIGTGWGSMAILAAQRFGCRVTTTTISREQHAYAKDKVRAAGLEDRVTLLMKDYRELEGRFTKIVSVEMIEAVGPENYPAFFQTMDRLLVDGGRAALQAITMTDQYYEAVKNRADFIKRYIFPGSCIPSATALLSAATNASRLRMTQYEDMTPHYAETMKRWRENLAPHRASVVQSYGERFWRMWMFYLEYCEAGFREHYIGSAQLVFEKPRYF